MAKARQFSPRALSFRRRKHLAWGIGLVACWAMVTILITLSYSDDSMSLTSVALALQFFIGLPGLVSGLLLVLGLVGETRAKRFNAQDWALADALHDRLYELSAKLAGTAHQSTDGEVRVEDACLIEIERHFDTQTSGMVTGAMTHQMRLFGTSFSASYSTAVGRSSAVGFSGGGFTGAIRGLSEVNLGVNTTTQANLLGDALFSVFEAPGPAGERDTYRVISMSQPCLATWIQRLVGFAAEQVGGQWTHSGATVLSWSTPLVSQSVSGDITYVTDRLKALHSRPRQERDSIMVRGVPVGRNAIIATTLAIGNGEELRLMPARFPELFGQALARGVANGQQRPSIQPATS